ncbi:MAG: hypothetical protein RBQ99_11100, partial [Trichlorobacter sp.]|nr:hypothetical protein [Trichlorobacter sp.]
MTISIKTVFMSFIFTLLLSVFITDYAEARNRSFPAGSYIIPADACWQPNNDPNMAKQDNACDTDKNDQSIFQLHGLLYALLDVGDQPGLCKNNDGSMPQQKALFGYCKQIRVNWVIDAEKDSQHTDDLVLSTTDAAINSKGIVQILNSNKLTKAGTNTKPVAYRGGPFVIDANDITAAEMEKLKAKFPSVKIHKANIPFSGNVDKVLVGKPPKVAVLDEIPQGQSNVSSDVLEDYIRASGLFSWKGTVFQKLSARDVIAGCLRDPVPASCKAQRPDISSSFQLLWAPHWVIEEKWSDGKVATAADQTAVIKEIRDFFERGSSGFFQCSSIGSLEGSKILTNGDTIGKNISAGVGGFLVGNENTWPRLDVNGGCFKGYNNSSSGNCSSDYLQFEEAPFWLTQCGGWEFKPGQGGVDSMRPSSGSGYIYHSTDKTDKTSHYVGSQLTRFIHDNPDKLNNKYTAAYDGYYVYDYLVGGRINGSPTQGYVIYFPGHKYVTCKTQRNYGYPPSRNIDFQFDKIPEGEIKVELVHGKCTQGNNCPTISYGSGSGADLVSADTWVTLNAEFAFLNSGSKRLEGIYFTSNFDDTTLTELQISKIRVFFNGGSDTEDKAKLLAVADVTQAGSRQVLCSPNATATTSSPAECSSTGKPATVFSMNFDEDISTAIVNKPVKVIIPVKGQSNRLEATFDVTTNTGTKSSTIGNLTLDLTNAVYDSGTYTLGNIVLERGDSCADITLSDILVDFPGTGIKLVAVYNTSTNEEVCTANSTAVAACSTPQTPLPNNSIKTSLNFDKEYFTSTWFSSGTNSTNITLKIDYDCAPDCSESMRSISATYTTSTRTKSGNTVSNTDITLDMSGASFTNSNKTLNNITITNK